MSQSSPVLPTTVSLRPDGRPAASSPGWSDLLPAGLVAGASLLLLVPLLFLPRFVIATVLVGFVVSLVGFLNGCLRAREAGSVADFDYLAGLGPFRWIIVIGLCGLYALGYLLLWTIAQIRAAALSPKRLLPWLGLQVFGFGFIGLSLLTAAIGDSLGLKFRGSQSTSQTASNPQNPENANGPAAIPDKTGDPEMDRLLEDLEAVDGAIRKAAADRLAAMKPNQHRAVIAHKLAAQLPVVEPFDREPLIRALAVWATAAEVPVLIQLLDSPEIHIRNVTLDALAKLRDERAVKPIVRCFKEFQTRWHSEQALKALGPMAEKEVLALLAQPDRDMWVPAIYVLAEIGTEQSLPALREASKQFEMKGVAEGAMIAIQKRMRKDRG
jgi:hypothetical protein